MYGQLAMAAASIYASQQKGAGGSEGGQNVSQHSLISGTQEQAQKDALLGLQNLTQTTPGPRNQNAPDANTLNQLRGAQNVSSLQNEGRLSLSGLDALRNQQASAAFSAAPERAGLQRLGQGQAAPYQERLQGRLRDAQERLQGADIANLRQMQMGGTTHSSAREAALRQMGTGYAREVGSAVSKSYEETEMQRQQLQLAALQASGQLGLGQGAQGMQSAQAMGQLELGGLGLTSQDLGRRQGLQQSSAQMLMGAQGANVQAQNLWNMQQSQQSNAFNMQRLQALAALGTAQTQENVVFNQQPSAGIWPAVVSGAAQVASAYADDD